MTKFPLPDSALAAHTAVLGKTITRITQCHHSEDRKVVIAGREYGFG